MRVACLQQARHVGPGLRWSAASLLCWPLPSSSSNAPHLAQHLVPHHQQQRACRCSSSSSNAGGGGSSSDGSSVPPRLPARSSELISSTSNAYVKHCVKLRENARYRQQQQRLLVAGGPLLAELAAAAPDGRLQALALFVKPDARPPPGVAAEAVLAVSDAVMRKLTGLEETGGLEVAAELPMPPYVDLLQASSSSSSSSEQLQRLLVLDGIRDPGNLGTLLRCAAAFGWGAVWLLPGCCDPFNDKALRASRGAAFKARLAAGNLEQLQDVLRRHDMLLLAAQPEQEQEQGGEGAAAPQPRSATSSSSRPVALVLGSEGEGLSPGVLEASSACVSIPMVAGAMESLNVGVAGAILMCCLSDGFPRLEARLQQLLAT